MDFLNDAQQACYEKVAPWMSEIFGDSVRPLDGIPVFEVTQGSAFAFVQVTPFHDDAVITARAYVVTEVELTAELMLFLMRENDTMRFGAFGIDEGHDVVYQHAIMGATVDQDELEATVKTVIEVADQYDDMIVEQFGGLRALDYIGSASA